MSSTDLERVLALVAEHETTLGAFVHVDAEAARAAAAQGRHGPLAGQVVAVKDNIAVRGAPWACGSASRLGRPPADRDAEVVRRVRDAGGVVLGTTNLDELAMGSSTESSIHGATHNPWDPDRSPGGSSGGSAAAVAAYRVLGIGTDTGGSIREPAAFCGVVGVAPSPGCVPTEGVVDFAPSMDRVGPLGTDVLSTARLHDAMAASDQMVRAARTGAQDGDLAGWRVARIAPASGAGNEPEVLLRFEEATETMRTAGARVVDVVIPRFGDMLDVYLAITSVEALPVLEAHEDGLGEEASSRLEIGRRLAGSAELAEALDLRERITADVRAVLADHDVVTSHTVPLVAPYLGRSGMSDPMAAPRTDWWTVEANLARLPAMSLPHGVSQGLPVGLQLMAGPNQDALLYRMAATLEMLLAGR